MKVGDEFELDGDLGMDYRIGKGVWDNVGLKRCLRRVGSMGNEGIAEDEGATTNEEVSNINASKTKGVSEAITG